MGSSVRFSLGVGVTDEWSSACVSSASDVAPLRGFVSRVPLEGQCVTACARVADYMFVRDGCGADVERWHYHAMIYKPEKGAPQPRGRDTLQIYYKEKNLIITLLLQFE